MFSGVVLKKRHPASAQVPLRNIGNPEERQIVPAGNHPQIGQRVLDFLPLKEGNPAVNGIGQLLPEKHLLHRACHIVSAVQDGHVPVGDALIVKASGLFHNPQRFGLLRLRVVAVHRTAAGQSGKQILLHPETVLRNQGVGDSQNLRCGAVVLHHHNRSGPRKRLVEFQQILYVGPAPGVDGLVRIAHNEQVPVVSAEDLHQLILETVNVLKLVNHDVFQSLLPFQTNVRMLFKDIQGEPDQIVIVQPEALLLLVEIPVEDHVVHRDSVQILLLQCVQ